MSLFAWSELYRRIDGVKFVCHESWCFSQKKNQFVENESMKERLVLNRSVT